MLIASSPTTSALAPHAADRSWVVFLQATQSASNGIAPIMIKAMRGPTMGRDLAAIAAANPYDVIIIGMIQSALPEEHARAIAAQYGGIHLHNDWYQPGADLLAYIQHVAQIGLTELLAQVHPGGISEHVVDVDQIAGLLGVSVKTVRRMVQRGEIPHMRWGRLLRFVPADVIAWARSSQR